MSSTLIALPQSNGTAIASATCGPMTSNDVTTRPMTMPERLGPASGASAGGNDGGSSSVVMALSSLAPGAVVFRPTRATGKGASCQRGDSGQDRPRSAQNRAGCLIIQSAARNGRSAAVGDQRGKPLGRAHRGDMATVEANHCGRAREAEDHFLLERGRDRAVARIEHIRHWNVG